MYMNGPIPPNLKNLYASIINAVRSTSDAFGEKPAKGAFDKNGEPDPQFDCYFFYHWVDNIPKPLKKEFREKLVDIGISRKAWGEAARKGIRNTNFARRAFECSAKYKQASVEQNLLGYINYAQAQGASLFGIKGHEDTVKALLAGSPSTQSQQSPDGGNNFPPNLKPKTNNKAPAGFSIRWENDICKIDEKPGKECLRLPNLSGNLSLDNVATLLGWQYQLTSFIGRKQELRQLHDWLDSPPDRSIQLIYGKGGVGKTRLAFHFAEEIPEKDWQAGQPDKDIAGDWVAGDKGMLLIIDYPEERQHLASQLVGAIKDMPDSRKKLRLLLISRNRDFLETLTAAAPGLVINPPIHLPGLKTEDEQWNLLEAAWDRLQVLKTKSVLHHHPSQESPLPIDKPDLIFWFKTTIIAIHTIDNHRPGRLFLGGGP